MSADIPRGPVDLERSWPDVTGVLSELAGRNGGAVLSNRRRLLGLLRDRLPDHPRAVRLIMTTFDQGVPARLRSARDSFGTAALAQETTRVVEETGISAAWIGRAVEAWATAILGPGPGRPVPATAAEAADHGPVLPAAPPAPPAPAPPDPAPFVLEPAVWSSPVRATPSVPAAPAAAVAQPVPAAADPAVWSSPVGATPTPAVPARLDPAPPAPDQAIWSTPVSAPALRPSESAVWSSPVGAPVTPIPPVDPAVARPAHPPIPLWVKIVSLVLAAFIAAVAVADAYEDSDVETGALVGRPLTRLAGAPAIPAPSRPCLGRGTVALGASVAPSASSNLAGGPT